jgi:hypothetical protein
LFISFQKTVVELYCLIGTHVDVYVNSADPRWVARSPLASVDAAAAAAACWASQNLEQQQHEYVSECVQVQQRGRFHLGPTTMARK